MDIAVLGLPMVFILAIFLASGVTLRRCAVRYERTAAVDGEESASPKARSPKGSGAGAKKDKSESGKKSGRRALRKGATRVANDDTDDDGDDEAEDEEEAKTTKEKQKKQLRAVHDELDDEL